MMSSVLNLLLADDDADDCFIFREALEELPISSSLSIVNDGVELMQFLAKKDIPLPNALFLDLNMPRKSGLDCLSEIRNIDKLVNLPIVIYSTALNLDVVKLLYDSGAHFYIQKPGEFDKVKKLIWEAISQIVINSKQPTRDRFILQT